MIEQLRAPNPGAFTLDGTNSYVIDRQGIIDPGPVIESHVRNLLQATPELRTILITHRHDDHAPAATELKRRSGARVVAPEGVLSDDTVDERLEDGGRYTIGSLHIEAIATPGHTGEHFCFLSDEGDLFTGDMILGSGTTAVFPPDGHMGDYITSLRALQARNPKRIYPGHGPIREDAVTLIASYISHRLEREAQIMATLSTEPRSITELRGSIYTSLKPSLIRAAEAQILAHLIHLTEQGRVTEQDGRYNATVT